MYTTITTQKGTEAGIDAYYSNAYDGYGHHRIVADVLFCGEKHTFTTRTSAMPVIDRITELRSEGDYEQVQQFYHSNFFCHIEEEVSEWIDQINDGEGEDE